MTSYEAVLRILEYAPWVVAELAEKACREEEFRVTHERATLEYRRRYQELRIHVEGGGRSRVFLSSGIRDGRRIVDPLENVTGLVLEKAGWESIRIDQPGQLPPGAPPRFVYAAPEATCRRCPNFLRCKLSD